METATAEDLRGLAAKYQADRRLYIEKRLWIKTKDMRVIPLVPNAGQEKLFDAIEAQEAADKPVRGIILKARQIGFSTAIQAILFHKAGNFPNVNGLTVAHDLDSTETMFQMDQLFLDKLDPRTRPMTRYSNRKEIVFENPDAAARTKRPGLRSQLGVATAGNVALGRSKTLHMLHRSEIAYWPKAEAASLSVLQAVPDEPGTIVLDESTASGVGTYFHKRWQQAKAGLIDCFALFLPWFEHAAYRRPLDAPVDAFMDSLNEDERKLRDAYKLAPEQLNWRRFIIADKCAGNVDTFRQEYPSNDVECFLLSGRPRFNRELLNQFIMGCETPKAIGFLKPDGAHRWRLEENPNGFIKIWKAPMPGRRYVIGADVAEGVKDGAFSAAHVLEETTGEECAVFHGHLEPAKYGDELNMLGRVYNEALMGVERNNHGHATLSRLKDTHSYPRLYWHKSIDTRTRRPMSRLGWPTDAATRPLMIDDLAAAQPDLLCHDKDTLEEMMTFVIDANGDVGPEDGCFGDRVISKSIALQMRKRAGLGGVFPGLRGK